MEIKGWDKKVIKWWWKWEERKRVWDNIKKKYKLGLKYENRVNEVGIDSNRG